MARVGLIPPVAVPLPPHTVDPRHPSLQTTAVAANRLDLQRVFGAPQRISKLAVSVGTSAGNLCLAVYSNTGVGTAARPAARLATTGSVPCPATGVAVVPLTAAVDVTPEMWFGIVCDSGTATFGRILGSGLSVLGDGFSQRMSEAFPAPATLSGLVGNGSGWLIVGVA